MNIINKILRTSLITLIFINLLSAIAISQQIEITPTPDWVVKRATNLNMSSSLNGDEGSIRYYLDDYQSYYDEIEPKFYTNQIFQLHTLQAIEQLGKIKITYNPAYQNYKIHNVNVIRDGEIIDKSSSIRITIDSYNTEINTPDHEGENIVNLYIADLRRDDIVNYSYSIIGQNPAFGNRAIGMSIKVAAIDVNNIYRRITAPVERKINFHLSGGHEAPQITQIENNIVYEWYWDKVDAYEEKTGVPIWYPSYPATSYSDYQSWSEVNDWATNLFKFETISSDLVHQTSVEITKNAENDLARLIDIFSFMQSEIRYTGLEIGRNGYRPFSPNEVISRRYGDCKDQTVLLIALLNEVGINASVALVNSLSGKMIANFGITPAGFNHAIVKATIGDNVYWLDPTLNLAKDKKADLTPPRYGKALVLEQGTNELTDIPLEEKDSQSPHILVTDHYALPNGVFGELIWTRETRYSGAIADFVRNAVDYMGIRQMGTSLRQSHQSSYDAIENNEFSSVIDEGDFYTVKEDYKVPKAGKYNENRDRTSFGFAPRNIAELLAKPVNISERDEPFALQYPARRRSIAYIDAPGAVFKNFDKHVQNPYFTYQFRGWYEDNSFKMLYDFETHQDHVPKEGLKRFKEDIELILAEMFIYIMAPGDTDSKILEVYQPILSQKQEMLNSNNMDAHEKIETFFNTGGLRYLKSSREEILDILQQDDIPTETADEFLKVIIGYAIETEMLDEAYFYHDIYVKGDERIPMPYIFSLVHAFITNNDYERAADVILKEIEYSSEPVNSSSAGYLQSLLREIYWGQKNFVKLRYTLEHITHYFPEREPYFRELGVVYDKLGLNDKAMKHRKIMNDMGYSDLPIEFPEEDSKFERFVRPLIRSAAIYPRNAEIKGLEGFVITEYTIKEDGSTKNCKVVESSNSIFDDAACAAAERFYYYPIDKSESGGEMTNFRTKIEFVLTE